MSTRVTILFEGYNIDSNDGSTLANGSCTLIETPAHKVLVDTLGPWNRDDLLKKLADLQLTPDQITHVVGTHGHPDHVGNMNLFTSPSTIHVLATSVYCGDRYLNHNFAEQPFAIKKDQIMVYATPGHTKSCVSVICRDVETFGSVAIVGDLFERKEDLDDESIWINAGSEDPQSQRANRRWILRQVDYIVPGHGPMFRVPANNH